jgi:hypothetical protein
MLILIRPGVQFKAVERHPLTTHPDLGDERPHLAVEPVAIHAEVVGRIAQPQKTRHDFHHSFLVSMHGLSPVQKQRSQKASVSQAVRSTLSADPAPAGAIRFHPGQVSLYVVCLVSVGPRTGTYSAAGPDSEDQKAILSPRRIFSVDHIAIDVA